MTTTDNTMTALTPRQEAFALEVASGKSQAEAYRTAYPKSQAWKDTAVWQQASRLMAVPHVAARVASHRSELAQRSLWAREDSVRSLVKVVRTADRPSDIVAAVKALNEMHGFNAPQKVEHSGAITSITRRIIDVGVTLERSGD
jgi:hypothetical protein